jgi:hypothetical protein
MLFYILKAESTVTKVAYSLKIYFHTSFEDLKVHGAGVAFEEGGHGQWGDLMSLLAFPH